MKHYKPYTSLAAASLLCLFVQEANSAILITGFESGPNVVFVASGSINTASLQSLAEPPPTGYTSTYFSPSTATIILGGLGTVSGEIYLVAAPITGPSSFGTGGLSYSSSLTGDSFGLDFITLPALGTLMWLPLGYVSDTPLSGTMTFENQSFATLGITEGSYTWSWSSGQNVDSQTLNVIPEPSSALFLGLAMLSIVVQRRRI